MSAFIGTFRVFIVLLALVSGTGSPALAQDPVRLDIPQARIVAERLYLSHQFRAAREVALGLLQRDPSDVRALIVLSQSERALGNSKPAADAGRKAWRAATNPLEKYSAALVTAQALSSGGARTRAQLWLRRATHVAPSEGLKRRAIRDFRYVQSRNPFTTNLSFSARPSSNINNGSKSDKLVIGGLPFELRGDSRALSGIEFSYGLSTNYKRQTDPDRLIRFEFTLKARSYALSSQAKRLAPDQDASDYAFLTAELSFGTTKLLGQGRGGLEFDLGLGRNWYAGKPLGDYTRITAARTFQKTKSTRSRYQFSVTQQWRKDNALRSSTQIALTTYWTKALENKALLRWHLGIQDTTSDSATIAQSGIIAGASITPKTDIFGAQITWSLGLQTRRYDLPSFGVFRKDNKATLGISLFFHEVDYFGFAPTLNLTASRNQSNISLYDTTEFGLSIGIRSTF